MGFRPDKFLIALGIVSLFIVMGVLIQQDMVTEYDLNVTQDDFGSVYNISDDLYNMGQDMKEDTLEGEIEGGDQSWESMTKGSYSAVRFIKDAFAIVGDMLDAIAKTVGVPVIFVTVAMTSLTIMIVFALIYLVFRFIPR